MDLIAGVQNSLPKGVYSKVCRYRYQVFVERLGWQLPTRHGIELDQFDRLDTVYVVAENDKGDIIGCARLLPTTGPYLLSEVFPQLLNGLPPPRSQEVWELSRFAAMDLEQPVSIKNQCSSPIAVQLLQESIACAANRGAKRLITVSPVGIERLLHKAGFKAHRAGPPVVVDGHAIVACLIEVT